MITIKSLKYDDFLVVSFFIFFISGFIVDFFIEDFRFSKNYRWIYSIGKNYSFFTFITSLLFSVLYSIISLKDNNKNIISYLSLIPLVYTLIVLIF